MSYLRKLLRVELIAIGGLLLSGAIFVAFLAIQTLLSDETVMLNADGIGFLIGLFSFFVIFGAVPVVLFGAPLYTYLLQTHRANWFTSPVLGLLPSFAFWYAEPALAPFAFITGALVAMFTHYFCRNVGNLTTQSSGTSA